MIKGQNTQHVLRIVIGVIIAYFIVKFFIRPIVFESGSFQFLIIFVFSFPNFCEAVAGSFFVVLVLLTIQGLLMKHYPGFQIHEKWIYLAAVTMAGIYVILQEYKVHNFGGVNIYDPFDVLYSIIGLVTAYSLLNVIQPKIVLIAPDS